MRASWVSPTQRRYSPEFKERAVRMVRQLRAETGRKQGTVTRVEAPTHLSIAGKDGDGVTIGITAKLVPVDALQTVLRFEIRIVDRHRIIAERQMCHLGIDQRQLWLVDEEGVDVQQPHGVDARGDLHGRP